MPKTAADAKAYLATITKPALDEFKIMVMLEAADQGLYDDLAELAPTHRIKTLLKQSGREELGHAHRIARLIGRVFGEYFVVPKPAENPYYRKPANLTLSPALLDDITQRENAGGRLYDDWAAAFDDREVARQFRRNGAEERQHGDRAQQVKVLLLSA